MNISEHILQREKGNSSHIYLYPSKHGAWVAYSHSAVNLNYLLPNIPLSRQSRSKSFEKILVDKLSLAWLLEKLPAQSRSEEMITLLLPDGF